jgi:hypothetical protein
MLNYFSVLCFVWAFIGIVSRIAMGKMGKNWAEWEMNKVYKEDKPLFITLIGIVGYVVVIVTWVMVFITDIQYSWILATLITLTLFKITKLLFNYKQFREFLVKTLKDKKKMYQLNTAVIILSIALISMGIFLY